MDFEKPAWLDKLNDDFKLAIMEPYSGVDDATADRVKVEEIYPGRLWMETAIYALANPAFSQGGEVGLWIYSSAMKYAGEEGRSVILLENYTNELVERTVKTANKKFMEPLIEMDSSRPPARLMRKESGETIFTVLVQMTEEESRICHLYLGAHAVH